MSNIANTEHGSQQMLQKRFLKENQYLYIWNYEKEHLYIHVWIDGWLIQDSFWEPKDVSVRRLLASFSYQTLAGKLLAYFRFSPLDGMPPYTEGH